MMVVAISLLLSCNITFVLSSTFYLYVLEPTSSKFLIDLLQAVEKLLGHTQRLCTV